MYNRRCSKSLDKQGSCNCILYKKVSSPQYTWRTTSIKFNDGQQIPGTSTLKRDDAQYITIQFLMNILETGSAIAQWITWPIRLDISQTRVQLYLLNTLILLCEIMVIYWFFRSFLKMQECRKKHILTASSFCTTPSGRLMRLQKFLPNITSLHPSCLCLH